jgi:hypothetical protein
MLLKRNAPAYRWTHANARFARILVAIVLLALFPRDSASRSDRVALFPKLQVGQAITYEISFRSTKQTKTQSSLVVAQAPGDVVIDLRALLRLEVLGIQPVGTRATIHARTWFQSLDADGKTKDPSGVAIEFTIFPDGHIDAVRGADQLSPDQQQAWRQWVSRFVAAAPFPEGGIKPTQKWRSEEAEQSSSPIASLAWVRESAYVRNEPCRPMRITQKGELQESDQPPDTCAIILTTATLKQLSHPKDATPDDFRVRQLRTSGTARGNNRTITYISLKTGLVVRASDDADQSMAVTIAKADGSNRVHYDVQAKSRAEILLVTAVTGATVAPQKSP